MRKKRLLSIFIFCAFIFTALPYINSYGIVKPKLQLISRISNLYKVGDKITLQFKAPNYSGKVQYRVILWNVKNKTQREIFAKKGYYSSYTYGNKPYNISFVLKDSGEYNLTVLVKRYNAKVSYDSYVKTSNFKVKDLDVSLNKEGTIYGSSETKNIDANVYVNADKITLKNLNVNGTIYIDPKSNGSAYIENVNCSSMEILSGGENSIHLTNVTSKSVKISSKEMVRVELKGNSNIKYLNIQGPSYLVSKEKSGDSSLIDSIFISAKAKDYKVKLEGIFNSVEVVNECSVLIDGTVNDFTLKSNAIISKTTNSDIKNIVNNGFDVQISTDDSIKDNGQGQSTTQPPQGDSSNQNDGTTLPPSGQIPPQSDSQSAPKLTGCGVLLSNDIEYSATESSNTFTVDISSLSSGIGVCPYFISDSDCKFNFEGLNFDLKANTKRIFTPEDLGRTDNPPRGISIDSLRSIYSDSNGYVTYSVILKKNDKSSTYTFKIKVK